MNTPVETRNAIEMLSTASGEVWKSLPITGSATLTIVTSSNLSLGTCVLG
jgi:hypothetical protein